MDRFFLNVEKKKRKKKEKQKGKKKKKVVKSDTYMDQ